MHTLRINEEERNIIENALRQYSPIGSDPKREAQQLRNREQILARDLANRVRVL
jgi:hypothetical protein